MRMSFLTGPCVCTRTAPCGHSVVSIGNSHLSFPFAVCIHRLLSFASVVCICRLPLSFASIACTCRSGSGRGHDDGNRPI